MKQLFILRHAQAEPGGITQADIDRALTAKGRKDAAGVGVFLAQEKLLPQKILVSPALRTRETFERVNSSLGLPHEVCAEIYNAEFEALLQLIIATDTAVQSLMIVGHNPGVHAIAAHFSKPGDTPHDFPPASLMVLNFIADWDELAQRSAQKQAFWTP